MSKDDTQVKLRLPSELRDQISESAKEHNRSMNADIVCRLENSFANKEDKLNTVDLINELISRYPKGMISITVGRIDKSDED